MPVQIKDIDFYSLHGLWGAYGSLALGRIGRGAGMVVGNVQPPARALFVGYRSGDKKPRFLPFVPGIALGIGASSYVAEDASAGTAQPKKKRTGSEYDYFSAFETTRTISMSGETWKSGLMSMTITSFFGEVPDPALSTRETLRAEMRPALFITLSFDNFAEKTNLTGVFGMQGIRRLLSDSTDGRLLGFAHMNDWGFALMPAKGIDEVMDWDARDAAFDDNPRALRRLSAEGCLRFAVAPGTKAEFVIVAGVYREGIVTAGVRTRAFQSSLFGDLEDVLTDALVGAKNRFERAKKLDAELDAAQISDDRKFLIAHAAHSYNASTELLLSENGEPIFLVNEGEYQMMNTLDLTIDQSFHEMHYSPWTVKNELDFFYRQSSYRDRDGLVFSHDQGVADCFTPKGTSSYELPRLTDCFSFMSYEETLNWVITSCLYAENADDGTWLAANKDIIAEALQSLLARDGNGDGIMDRDSDRCQGGAEITTYDSLDASLGQARNNLYIAVKAWAAFVSIASVFEKRGGENVFGFGTLIKDAHIIAAKIAESIVARVVEGEGYIPAVFENGNESRIIPAIEGLVYPLFCGASSVLAQDGPYGSLIRALKIHLEAVLVPGVCLDAKSGGWKLSSTSKNTWLSKIYINQFVAETVFGMKDERISRDSAHVHWQCNGSADWASTDQVDSSNGKDLGSRLYPRLVSSILWIHPPKA